MQYFDNVASCLLVDFPDSKMVQKCFDHKCNSHWLQRRQFQAVEDQELRNLRHRAYYAQDKNRHIMNCQHCGKGWSAEDMVLSYNNVVGATMASFLIQNKSRFVFSHETVWCPLKQFILIINGEDTNAVIHCNGKVPFFDCTTLHYLCRPIQLESINVFEFYGNYEIVNKTRENESELLELINDKFQHASFNRTKMKFLQGVKKRLKPKLVRICQYDFPDTKCFGSNMLDDKATINVSMEIYCRNVLLLLFPFRSKDDLIIEGSYTKRLCSVIYNHELKKNKFEYFLDNVQNCKAICL